MKTAVKTFLSRQHTMHADRDTDLPISSVCLTNAGNTVSKHIVTLVTL